MTAVIQGYLNENNLNEVPYDSKDFEDYINDYFNAGNENYLYDHDLDAARKALKEARDKKMIGIPYKEAVAKNIEYQLWGVFGKDNVIRYESRTQPGHYIVRVAKPRPFKSTESSDTTTEQGQESAQGELTKETQQIGDPRLTAEFEKLSKEEQAELMDEFGTPEQ